MALGRNQLKNAINTAITDPLNNQNTAKVVRDILKLMVDNALNLADDEVGDQTFPVGYVAKAGVVHLEAGTALGGKNAIEAIMDMVTPPFAPAVIYLNGLNPIEKGALSNITVSGGINLNDETSITNRRLERNGIAWKNPATNAVSEADSISAQTTYGYKATTSAGEISAFMTVAAYAPSYHDSTAMAGITEGIAKTGTKEIWGPQGSRAITYTNNNSKPYLVEPQSNGIRNRIMDQNGFNVTAAFTRTTLTFTLADGSTEPMYAYLKTDPAGDGNAFVYTFYNN